MPQKEPLWAIFFCLVLAVSSQDSVSTLPSHFGKPYYSFIHPQTAEIFIVQRVNHTIIKLDSNFNPIVYCGQNGVSGFANGRCNFALLQTPTFATVDKFGDILFVERGNPAVRKISHLTQEVSVVSGANNVGYKDGPVETALFRAINHLAIDASGAIFLLDQGNNRIRKIFNSNVETIAGTGIAGKDDGPLLQASFQGLAQLVISANILYVIQTTNSSLRAVDLTTNTVTTLVTAPFLTPESLIADCDPEILLIGDGGRRIIYQYNTSSQSLTPHIGSGLNGNQDGNFTFASFGDPLSLFIDPPSGFLLISDQDNNLLRGVEQYCAPVLPAATTTTTTIPNITDSKIVAIIAGASAGSGLILIGVVVLVLVLVMKRRKSKRLETDEASLQSINLTLDDDQVPFLSNVTIESRIGEGNFSIVYKGKWDGIAVACKLLKDVKQLSSFLLEAATMKQLSHPNIVQFFGVFRDSKNATFLVSEYCPLGGLDEMIRNDPQSFLKVEILMNLAHDCAAGMKYLSERHIVHRDVALRNVLVKKDGDVLVAKITDFGLSRATSGSYYVSSEKGEIAIKWAAIEALEYGKYSTQSDVWSFGVLLWEIFSLGKLPFSSMTNNEAIQAVKKGERLDIPEGTPKKVAEAMEKCWEEKPTSRPSFQELEQILKVSKPPVPSASSKPQSANTGQPGSFYALM